MKTIEQYTYDNSEVIKWNCAKEMCSESDTNREIVITVAVGVAS